MLDVLSFPPSWSPSLAADNQGAWVGFINCLAARNLVINFALFLKHFHREDKTFKFYKNTAVYKLPWGAIYKPCMHCHAVYKQPLFCYTSSFCTVNLLTLEDWRFRELLCAEITQSVRFAVTRVKKMLTSQNPANPEKFKVTRKTKKWLLGLLLGLLWGIPQKSLFSHSRVTSNFSGFGGVLGVSIFLTRVTSRPKKSLWFPLTRPSLWN